MRVGTSTSNFSYDFPNALDWAFRPSGGAVPVLSSSIGSFTYNNSLNFFDKTADYYTYLWNTLLVQASGNSNGGAPWLASPAKAWNVISVGSFDDHNNSQWADDSMSSFSSFYNPTSPHSDREKPEVVAVGEQVTTLGENNDVVTEDGTSFAAPMVSGQVALMLHRNNQLGTYPEAVRAILLATSFNNIEGASVIIPGEDERDGVGGLNAAKADTAAANRCSAPTLASPCTAKAWWGSQTIYSSTGDFDWYFNVTGLKKIRVAIAWWSNSDCTQFDERLTCEDRLDTDLDLQVFDPNGNYVSGGVIDDGSEESGHIGISNGSSSASWDNNYEVVEFKANVTGVYRLHVHKARMDESGNYVGIAVFKK